MKGLQEIEKNLEEQGESALEDKEDSRVLERLEKRHEELSDKSMGERIREMQGEVKERLREKS